MKPRNSDNRTAAQELRTVALFGYRKPIHKPGALVRKMALDAHEECRLERANHDPLMPASVCSRALAG